MEIWFQKLTGLKRESSHYCSIAKWQFQVLVAQNIIILSALSLIINFALYTVLLMMHLL